MRPLHSGVSQVFEVSITCNLGLGGLGLINSYPGVEEGGKVMMERAGVDGWTDMPSCLQNVRHEIFLDFVLWSQ